MLTQTNNEFDAPTYNLNFPAHWAYPGMGPAYQNIGAVMDNVTLTNGQFPIPLIPLANAFYTPGDELEYATASGGLSMNKLWITEPTAGTLIVMDENGNPVTLSTTTLKVIRSGHRNMSGTPIGNLVTLHSPASSGSINPVTSSMGVLQANATLYNDAWKVPITDVPTLVCNTSDDPNLTCVANFMDSLMVHQQIWASPSDSILFGKYCPGCGDASALYYALTPPVGYNGIIDFSAQLGNCKIEITSLLEGGTPAFLYTSGYSAYPPDDYTKLPCITIENEAHQYVASVCMSCETCQTICVNLGIGNPFNPYAIGMLGDWRPERNYVYYDSRTPTFNSSASDIWKNGTFQNISPIWMPGPTWILDTLDPKWTWAKKVTMYDAKGNGIEEQDALGIYSSGLYGYSNSLPTAVSSNAKYKDT